MPVALTCATLPFDVENVIVRPASALPVALHAVAVSCCVPPTASETDGGESVTELTVSVVGPVA
jgi:hypothetical protein